MGLRMESIKTFETRLERKMSFGGLLLYLSWGRGGRHAQDFIMCELGVIETGARGGEEGGPQMWWEAKEARPWTERRGKQAEWHASYRLAYERRREDERELPSWRDRIMVEFLK